MGQSPSTPAIDDDPATISAQNRGRAPLPALPPYTDGRIWAGDWAILQRAVKRRQLAIITTTIDQLLEHAKDGYAKSALASSQFQDIAGIAEMCCMVHHEQPLAANNPPQYDAFDALVPRYAEYFVLCAAITCGHVRTVRHLLVHRALAVPVTLLAQPSWLIDKWRRYDPKAAAATTTSTSTSTSSDSKREEMKSVIANTAARTVSGNVITYGHWSNVPEDYRPLDGNPKLKYRFPKHPELPPVAAYQRAIIHLLCCELRVCDINAQAALPDPSLLTNHTWLTALSEARSSSKRRNSREGGYGDNGTGELWSFKDQHFYLTESYGPLLYHHLRLYRGTPNSVITTATSSSSSDDAGARGGTSTPRGTSGAGMEPSTLPIQSLLEMNADPNVETFVGHNSLIRALTTVNFSHQFEVVKLLVAAGANPSFYGHGRNTKLYRTPLSMAVDGYIAGTGTTAITRICLFAFVLYRVGAAGVYHRYKVDISIYLLERGANVADTVRILHGLDTRAVQWVKSTGNAKLLEALCEHGLQIGDSAREAIVAMERDTSTTAGMGVASRAIERGSKLFHDKVKVLTAAVGDAQLPRVLAYIVAEYAMYFIPSVEQLAELASEAAALRSTWQFARIA